MVESQLIGLQDPLSQTVPYFPITPPSKPAVVQTIDIELKANASGNVLWHMNGSPFRANFKYVPISDEPSATTVSCNSNVIKQSPVAARKSREHLLPQ